MKKKIFIIVLACVMLVLSSISVFAIVDACGHPDVIYDLIIHHKLGSSCIAIEQEICTVCGDMVHEYEATYSSCPRWHKQDPQY